MRSTRHLVFLSALVFVALLPVLKISLYFAHGDIKFGTDTKTASILSASSCTAPPCYDALSSAFDAVGLHNPSLWGSWRQVGRQTIPWPKNLNFNRNNTNWAIALAPLPRNQLVQWCIGWNVIVLHDKQPSNLPSDCSINYFTKKTAVVLESSLPSCKNNVVCAHLFAIDHGADAIAIIDQKTPFPGREWFVPSKTKDVWINQPSLLVNPFHHYGHCNVWPRFFPLHTKQFKSHCNLLYSGGKWAVHAPVQHLLTAQDVDPAWHIVFPHSLQHTANSTKLPLAVSTGSFAPFTAVNTIYYKAAFWAINPNSTGLPNYAYFIQPLLWAIGANLLFHANSSLLPTKQISYLEIAEAIKSDTHIRFEMLELLEVLQRWKCQFSHLPGCMVQLAIELVHLRFWSDEHIKLVVEFIHDLQAVGYDWPELVKESLMPLAYKQPLPAQASSVDKSRMRLYWQARYKCGADSHLHTLPHAPVSPSRTSVYLTIILTIHNVDSQGNHFRLSHFLKMLADNTKLYQLHESVELIIVDYNSDMTAPHLFDAATVTWPSRETLPLIRVFRIPPDIHSIVLHKVQSPVRAEYFEFVGKNAAIRRACGDYILTVNADSWLSPSFFEVIQQRSLSDRFYYRLGRISSSKELPHDSLNWSQAELTEFFLSHNTGAFSSPPVVFYHHNKITREWMNAKVAAPHYKDEGNVAIISAPGDFTMMHKRYWFEMRGHPEVPLIGMVDDFVVWLAVALGLHGATFNAPVAMVHMFHTSRHYSLAKEVLDETTSAYRDGLGQDIIAWTRDVVVGKKFVVFNDNDWGLVYSHIPESFL